MVFSLKRTLERAGGYSEVFAIHRARIPIVKFRDASIPCPPPQVRVKRHKQQQRAASSSCIGSGSFDAPHSTTLLQSTATQPSQPVAPTATKPGRRGGGGGGGKPEVCRH